MIQVWIRPKIIGIYSCPVGEWVSLMAAQLNGMPPQMDGVLDMEVWRMMRNVLNCQRHYNPAVIGIGIGSKGRIILMWTWCPYSVRNRLWLNPNVLERMIIRCRMLIMLICK